MRSLDIFGIGQIGDGPGDLEDAVIGAGGERELFHRLLEEVAEPGFQGTMPAKLGVGHPSVGDCIAAFEALELSFAGAQDPLADWRGGLARLGRAQLGKGDRRSFDVDVDPVEEGSADPGAVSFDLRGRAFAPVPRIPEVPTGARVSLFTATLGLGKKFRPPDIGGVIFRDFQRVELI